jgi:hypothetical protein
VKALVIPVNGDEAYEVVVDGEDFRSLAAAIDAEYIELVRIADRAHYLVVDETGLLTNRPVNPRASRLYPGPTGIRGDALLVGWDESATFRDENEIGDVCLMAPDFDAWLNAYAVR